MLRETFASTVLQGKGILWARHGSADIDSYIKVDVGDYCSATWCIGIF